MSSAYGPSIEVGIFFAVVAQNSDFVCDFVCFAVNLSLKSPPVFQYTTAVARDLLIEWDLLVVDLNLVVCHLPVKKQMRLTNKQVKI